ncbi:hypothetical protein [Streptomyces klenkii]|uniref:hypothetical protein n=1 Tax=Streptomyces klenkii TaxID=1420899 RepID=UPI003413B4D4
MGTAVAVRDPKEILGEAVWDREVKLLVRDNLTDTVMAGRLLGQAVAYLITAMETMGQGLELGCGELVDTAVHALILDTENYAEFCNKYNHGKFLHHIPEIERKADGTVMRTAAVVEKHGFEVDWPLWERDASTCSPCTQGTSCH